MSKKRSIRGTRGTPIPIVSDNPYEPLRKALRTLYGPPTYEVVLEGEPRGFTASRDHDKASRKSYEWARNMRNLLEHDYELEHLTAKPDVPLLIYTEAWFDGGRHCDPENVAKLARDALFYNAPKGTGKDKHTAGVHAGPLYDKIRPRTEVDVWELEGAVESRQAIEAARSAEVQRKPDERVRQVKSNSRIEKVKNPFGALD